MRDHYRRAARHLPSSWRASLRERYGLDEVIVAECFEDREEADPVGDRRRGGPLFRNDAERRRGDRHLLVERVAAPHGRQHPSRSSASAPSASCRSSAASAIPRCRATPRSSPPGWPTLTGAEPQLLPAQGVVSSSAARLVMLGDSYVRATTDQFRRVTIALVGIGALQPSVMLANSGNAFTERGVARSREPAARSATSCLRFFDQNGAPVGGPLDERVIGMTLRRTRSAVRGSSPSPAATRKVQAIRGVPARRLRQVLITDKFTAEKLV